MITLVATRENHQVGKYLCGYPLDGIKTVSEDSKTQRVDLCDNMEYFQRDILHAHRYNVVSEAPPPPRSPDPGKYPSGPLTMGRDGQDSHIIPPHLRPTFGEGVLDEDERLVPIFYQPCSAARSDHHQVDIGGVGCTLP